MFVRVFESAFKIRATFIVACMYVDLSQVRVWLPDFDYVCGMRESVRAYDCMGDASI